MFDAIPDITAQRAQLDPDAIAFRNFLSGQTLTYKELDRNTCRTAGLLADLPQPDGVFRNPVRLR